MMEHLNILIIEDEEPHFQLMKRAITRDFSNPSILYFNEAVTALEKLATIRPDVILVDYLVPGMNGLEFLEALNGQAKEIPIIMITGQGDENIAVQALKLGAWDYVVKTADFFKLLPSTIEKVIRKQRLNESLRAVERRFRDLAESTSDWIWETDAEGTFLYSNPGVERMLGYSPDEIVGMHFYDLFPPEERESLKELAFSVASGGQHISGLASRLIRKDGSEVIVETSSVPILDSEGRVAGRRGIDRDITERTWADRLLQTSHRFLEIANSSTEMAPMLDAFVSEIQQLTGCEATAIRILNPGGDIPYLSCSGFSKQFQELENPLSIRSDKCMCTEVIQGSTDSSLPYFTEGGSFFISGATRSPAAPWTEGRTRSACRECGYETVALVPIRAGDLILGLIHLADSRKNRLTERMIHLLERAAMELGTAIQRVRTEEALWESENRLRSLSTRLLHAQEEERKRIAGELHDSIGASLGAIKFSLENALRQAEQGEATTESIYDLIQMTQHTIEEARRIYTDLRPSMLDDLGIVATIGWFCRKYQSIHPNLGVEVRIGLEEEQVPEAIKIVVFRIIQESLHNVAKYSKADLVRVSFEMQDGAVELTVRDDGTGFDAGAVRSRRGRAGGLGLTSMRERTELSGGRFTVVAAPGQGTAIHACWPSTD